MTDASARRGDEVIVIGAGLIGLFSAYYLAESGRRVTLVERSAVGSGAARVNGGWVCPARSDPMPSPEVVREGLRSLVRPGGAGFFLRRQDVPTLASFLIRFLRASTPSGHARAWDKLDVLNRQTHTVVDRLVESGLISDLQDEGFLLLYPDEADALSAHEKLSAVAKRGLSPAPEPVLSRAGLLALEPGLGPAAQHGFLHRGDRWLDPSRLVDSLAERLIELGAEFRLGETVTAVRQSGDRVQVLTSRGTAEAPYAVVAAGAWSEEILRTLGVRGMVTPGKGYGLSIHPEQPYRHVLRLGSTHLALTPMGDRGRLVGIVEFDGTYQSLNLDRIEHMRHTAAPYLAGVDWARVTDQTVAPRPMTPDGMPLIGRLPHADRVVVATGHNMLGLSLGPVTGRLVADIVAGRSGGPDAFDPMRFTRDRLVGSEGRPWKKLL